MTNMELYKRTVGFSIRKLLFDLLSVVILAALCIGGFLLADKLMNKGLIGLLIGLLLGIVAVALISRFLSYTFKAGQIAMMTRGIIEGSLPDDVYAEGKRVVKERFATIALFFAATRVIKGIFNQLGHALTKLGDAIGGDAGGAVGSAISAAVQTLIAYLCDCCLGWVFFRKEQSAAKATCEGAVLFFRHGKTLLRNAGRIFGMGLASLVLIGGVLTGIFWLILSQFSAAFTTLAAEMAEASARMETELPSFLMDPATLTIISAALLALILWSLLHSTFIRPFVLTGVLRNYLESGKDDVPTEESFEQLAGKSKRFARLQEEL